MMVFNKLIKSFILIYCFLLISACVASTKTQENAGEYIQNSTITTNIKAALLKDKYIKSLPITVKTYKGQVQLSGFVEDQTQANRAIAIARSVQGVRSVHNNLIVQTRR